METVITWINHLVRAICTLLILAMLMAVGGQVVSRLIFGVAWIWVEEMIRYALTWLGFLGITLAVMENSHAEVNFFTQKMPKSFQKIITIAVLLLSIGFFLFLVAYGYRVAVTQARFMSPILRVSAFYRFIALPISSIIIVFDLSVKTISKIRSYWMLGPSAIT